MSSSPTDAETRENEEPQAGCGGGCACGSGGCGQGARTPELDARVIDPAIRQAAVFGVLIGQPPGGRVVIVTDSRPDLVLTLLEGQFAGQYDIEVAEAGEGEWRSTFVRRSS